MKRMYEYVTVEKLYNSLYALHMYEEGKMVSIL